MLGCVGAGTATKLAEIIAATVLAGEISIIGSMSAGDFAQAHAAFGRKKQVDPSPES
jgi:hydroxymethylglutaryl-CoA reductase (NADPH)